jgi:hypothetical protein
VDAIWNPPDMKCTRVPVPPHVLHSDLLTPDFSPLPEHVLHVVKGVIVIVLLAPFAASINDTVICTSILSPTRISVSCWKGFRPPPERPLRPPVNPLKRSSKLKSAPKPPPKPPGKPPAPVAPPKGPPPANGSPPGPGPAQHLGQRQLRRTGPKPPSFADQLKAHMQTAPPQTYPSLLDPYLYPDETFLPDHSMPS